MQACVRWKSIGWGEVEVDGEMQGSGGSEGWNGDVWSWYRKAVKRKRGDCVHIPHPYIYIQSATTLIHIYRTCSMTEGNFPRLGGSKGTPSTLRLTHTGWVFPGNSLGGDSKGIWLGYCCFIFISQQPAKGQLPLATLWQPRSFKYATIYSIPLNTQLVSNTMSHKRKILHNNPILHHKQDTG